MSFSDAVTTVGAGVVVVVVVDVVVVVVVACGRLNRDGARDITTGAIVVGTSVVVISLGTVVIKISSDSFNESGVVVDVVVLDGRFLRTLRVRVADLG